MKSSNTFSIRQSYFPVHFFTTDVRICTGGRTVGGLIGEATISKNGLMPSYRVMSTVYSVGKPVKYSIPGYTGFSFIISVYKNHEHYGAANILISGYSGGLLATALRKNEWLGGISYISKGEEEIDIYVKVQPYVYVSAACLGTSNGKFITSSILVNEVPFDAIDVPIS